MSIGTISAATSISQRARWMIALHGAVFNPDRMISFWLLRRGFIVCVVLRAIWLTGDRGRIPAAAFPFFFYG